MSPKKVFFGLTALVIIILGVMIAGVVLGNKVFQSQAKQLIDLKLEDKLIEEQQAAVIKGNKDLEKYADLEKVARTVVPQDKDQAKTVREITQIAEESGIPLQSITFQTSTLGAAPAPTPTQEGQASTAPPPTPSQLKPVTGIPGVYALEIVISPLNDDTPYEQFLGFLERLEKNRRTAHVDKISVTPSNNGRTVGFTLTLNAYVKP